jgi:hypothetical protein
MCRETTIINERVGEEEPRSKAPILSDRSLPKIVSIWFSHELCFGRYTNRIRWLNSDKNACRLATDFRIPRVPFLPKSFGTSQALATNVTKRSEQCMFKLSTTNTPDPSGSAAAVCSM